MTFRRSGAMRPARGPSVCATSTKCPLAGHSSRRCRIPNLGLKDCPFPDSRAEGRPGTSGPGAALARGMLVGGKGRGAAGRGEPRKSAEVTVPGLPPGARTPKAAGSEISHTTPASLTLSSRAIGPVVGKAGPFRVQEAKGKSPAFSSF